VNDAHLETLIKELLKSYWWPSSAPIFPIGAAMSVVEGN
jgi:hypothetical protein